MEGAPLGVFGLTHTHPHTLTLTHTITLTHSEMGTGRHDEGTPNMNLELTPPPNLHF